MAEASAWRAAYRYPYWRSAEERTSFADYYSARTVSSDSRVLANHYGDWLDQQ